MFSKILAAAATLAISASALAQSTTAPEFPSSQGTYLVTEPWCHIAFPSGVGAAIYLGECDRENRFVQKAVQAEIPVGTCLELGAPSALGGDMAEDVVYPVAGLGRPAAIFGKFVPGKKWTWEGLVEKECDIK